jgi:hypothetical protein
MRHCHAPEDDESSENWDFGGPNNGGTVGAVDGSWNGGRAAGLAGQGQIVTDTISWGSGMPSVENVSIFAVYNATYTLPNHTTYPLDVGFLSLGASNNQYFSLGDSGEDIVGRMVPLELSATGFVPSNTWSMHIGSVEPEIPRSLVLGGYDQSRVLGTVTSWPTQGGLNDMIISLLDISIGVASGASPFTFVSNTDLLVGAGISGRARNVRPNPTIPYLYLPGDTCKPITANLPVTYIPSLDLYSWDTTSPNYIEIVTSPSYLAFTFQAPGSSSNMTVKVPFALLNLTLTSPLIEAPTQYLPCKSYAPAGPDSQPGNEYYLGRAFLQAAFIGMNWHNKFWWMAQAPRPKFVQPYTVTLQNSTTTLESSAESTPWANSWSDFLTPIPDPGLTPLPKPGLSTGDKVGIGVGSVAGFIVILGGIFFLVRRSRRSKQPKGASDNVVMYGVGQKSQHNDRGDDLRAIWERQELDSSNNIAKQAHERSPVELPANQQ